ncbi:MAG: hypothetical protein ACRD0U_07225 [Acidimicrobiales bacterium]
MFVALAGVGVAVYVYVLQAAVRTVVVPMGEPGILTRVVFQALRAMFSLKLKRVTSYQDRDRAMAMHAPLGLVLLPGAWIALVILTFTGVLWGLGADPLRRAFTMSGSSILTLGFVVPPDLPTSVAAFVEATLGLGLVALLISYLPSIYGAFQRREMGVARMATLAGSPPSAVDMLMRYHKLERLTTLERLTEIDELWDEWDRWFADIEETQTSQPSLVFFRSISHERSWLTAAAVVLDAAAFRAGVLDLPRNPRAEICSRSGYIALRRIATYYSIPFDPAPDPGDAISVERSEFPGCLRPSGRSGRTREARWRAGLGGLGRLAGELRLGAAGAGRAATAAVCRLVVRPVAAIPPPPAHPPGPGTTDRRRVGAGQASAVWRSRNARTLARFPHTDITHHAPDRLREES